MSISQQVQAVAGRNCVLRDLIAATYRVARRRLEFTSLDVLAEAGDGTRKFAADSRLMAIALRKTSAPRLRYCTPSVPPRFALEHDRIAKDRPRRVWRSLIHGAV